MWLARLSVEQAVLSGMPIENRRAVRDVWSEARGKCQGAGADVTEVWLWGVPAPSLDNTEADSDAPQGNPSEDLEELRTLFDVRSTISEQFLMLIDTPSGNAGIIDHVSSSSVTDFA